VSALPRPRDIGVELGEAQLGETRAAFDSVAPDYDGPPATTR